MTALPINAIPGLGSLQSLQPLQPVGTLPTQATAPSAAGGTSFSQLLTDKIGSVVDLQHQADAASQAVATGQSSDLAGATIAVEKASIAMELTGAIRNKVIDAYQEIMRMQV